MAEGGTLTFVTENAELTEADTLAEPAVKPGRFVRLRRLRHRHRHG